MGMDPLQQRVLEVVHRHHHLRLQLEGQLEQEVQQESLLEVQQESLLEVQGEYLTRRVVEVQELSHHQLEVPEVQKMKRLVEFVVGHSEVEHSGCYHQLIQASFLDWLRWLQYDKF